MAEPFLSEIRMMSFMFPPKDWALANGQFLPINQNQALFALLGTVFGGDGRVTFALPDFRGRVPISVGNGHSLGERGGENAHTINLAELPQHSHTINVADHQNLTNSNSPINNYIANSVSGNAYNATLLSPKSMATTMLVDSGGSQPHTNIQPYLTISFCIALSGLFPSPS
jgi:microcystin-dependent protein